MVSKFSYPYIGICSDVTKCKFSVKNNTLKYWLCFRLFFLADTKIIYGYNFVAQKNASMFYFERDLMKHRNEVSKTSLTDQKV